MRAGAPELVDQVVAGSSVLAGIGITIVDVEFAVAPLVAFGTGALVGSNQIFAGGSILTGVSQAFVDFILTVAAVISFKAHTFVTVSRILAVASVLTKPVRRHTVQTCRHVARYATHVTHFAGPTVRAVTVEACTTLRASSAIFTRRIATPVDDLFTLAAGPAGGAVAGEKAFTVKTCAAVSAGFLVAG